MLIDSLVAWKDEHPNEQFDQERLRASAELLQVSVDHLRRLIRTRKRDKEARRGYRVDATALQALIRVRGRRKIGVAHRLLKSEGYDFGGRPNLSESQFRRAVRAQVPHDFLARIALGDSAAQQLELRIPIVYARPFEALYLDSKLIPIYHKVGDGVAALVYETSVRCAVCAAIVGRPVHTIGVPNQRDILKALQLALVHDPDWGPYSGLLETLHMDQATASAADSVSVVLVALGKPAVHSDGYYPEQNGYIESYHSFVELDFASTHPFYARGPKRRDGSPYLPALDTAPTVEQLIAERLAWARWYNETWTPSTETFAQLAARFDEQQLTPRRAWELLEPKPDPIPPEKLRWLSSFGLTRVVVFRQAIEVNTRTYVHPKFVELNGQFVWVGDADERAAQVFDDAGSWLCEAWYDQTLSGDEVDALKRARADARSSQRDAIQDVLEHYEQQARGKRANEPEPYGDFEDVIQRALRRRLTELNSARTDTADTSGQP